MAGRALPFSEKELLSSGRVAGHVASSRLSIQRVHESCEGVELPSRQVETGHAGPRNAVANDVTDFLNGLTTDPAVARQTRSLIGPTSVRAVATDAAFGVRFLAFR